MEELQGLVKGYLKAAKYNLLDERHGFVVADRLEWGAVRDTRLFWMPSVPTAEGDFARFEQDLLRECEARMPAYPGAKSFIIVRSRGGFSRNFHAELRRLGVSMRVPVEFFDAPFRFEEAPGAASAIQSLREAESPSMRAPQPYRMLAGKEYHAQRRDLLPDLYRKFKETEQSSLYVVVGPAGGGKSVLFRTLFSSLYEHFLEEKRKRNVCPRPIPLIPEYVKDAPALRTEQLIDSFLRTDVAAPVTHDAFKWMLLHGFATWLFDGLDELYAGDPDFFDSLLELLTAPSSRANILICARHSLLRSCESFARFLEDFPPSAEGPVRVYELDHWERTSKRALAWARLEGRPRKAAEDDTDKVSQFLHSLDESPALRKLSGLPYYCFLLADEFEGGRLREFADDSSLVEHAVSGIISREVGKGLLSPDRFEHEGLEAWIETVGLEAYEAGFKGISVVELREYARMVLRDDLTRNELSDTLTSMVQFPLFAPGARPGLVTFQHELIGEYLAARYLLGKVGQRAPWVARSLRRHSDFGDSLIARYMAKELGKRPDYTEAVVRALREQPLVENEFANLLDLLLLSTPRSDIVRSSGISVEGRDLSYVRFIDRDLGGVSFRNCDLSSTLFRRCNLQNARLEGAQLVGTRFEDLADDALRSCSFGSLSHFQHVYVGGRTIDDINEAADWLQGATGVPRELMGPCPAFLQLRTLLLKFVRPDGAPRRRQLGEQALGRGRRHVGAPGPEECLQTCRRFGYLEGPDDRHRYKCASGGPYEDVVRFVRDWQLSGQMRQLLGCLCRTPDCRHMPSTL